MGSSTLSRKALSPLELLRLLANSPEWPRLAWAVLGVGLLLGDDALRCWRVQVLQAIVPRWGRRRRFGLANNGRVLDLALVGGRLVVGDHGAPKCARGSPPRRRCAGHAPHTPATIVVVRRRLPGVVSLAILLARKTHAELSVSSTSVVPLTTWSWPCQNSCHRCVPSAKQPMPIITH